MMLLQRQLLQILLPHFYLLAHFVKATPGLAMFSQGQQPLATCHYCWLNKSINTLNDNVFKMFKQIKTLCHIIQTYYSFQCFDTTGVNSSLVAAIFK